MNNRRRWRFWPAFSLTFLLLWACACAVAQPLAWVAEKDGHRLVLFGSIHYGREDFYPLPAPLMQEFSTAEAVAVELDITALEPAQTLPLMMELGLLPAATRLSAALGPKIYRQLNDWCEQSKVPCASFDRLQPWVIALQVMEVALSTSSLKPELGVERVLLNARKQQQVVELESLSQQLRLFANLDLATQAVLLAQTLADYGDSKHYMEAMADAWLAGNATVLEAMINEPLKQEPELGAKLLQALLYSRNRPMAVAAEQLLNTHSKSFFLVGVGHLIGRDSVIDHLRRRGIEVRPFEYPPQSAAVAAALD